MFSMTQLIELITALINLIKVIHVENYMVLLKMERMNDETVEEIDKKINDK